MVRRSMVLLMALLAALLITPNSALAAKDVSISNFKAKVFATDSNGDTVSATFICSGGFLSSRSSFFFQLADGSTFYGDIVPTGCSLTQAADGTLSATIPAAVNVESPNSGTGSINLQFAVPKSGHNFTSPSVDCGCSINLMLSITNTSQTFSGGTDAGTEATLLLSARG